VAISPDGKLVAAGSVDNSLKLWDADSGEERASLENVGDRVRGVAFSPDGKTLATAATAADLLKLGIQESPQASNGEERVSFKGHKAYVTSVAFTPDDKILASGSRDRTAKL